MTSPASEKPSFRPSPMPPTNPQVFRPHERWQSETVAPEPLTQSLGAIHGEKLTEIKTILEQAEAILAEQFSQEGSHGSVELRLLPIGSRDPYDLTGENRDRRTPEQERSLAALQEIAAEWGNGSRVWDCDVETSDGDRVPLGSGEDELVVVENLRRYHVATLLGPDGELQAMAADTLDKDNALLLWRADTSAAFTLEEVLGSPKGDLVDEAINGARVYHVGDMKGRAMAWLTMSADKYMKERAKARDRAARDRLRAMGRRARAV